jgi:hypothetical protein
MNLKYRILRVNAEDHSFAVRYFTDILTEDLLCSYFDADGNIVRDENNYPLSCKTDTNVTIFNNPNPSQDDIIKLVTDYSSTMKDYLAILELQLQPNAVERMANVTSLVNTTGVITLD